MGYCWYSFTKITYRSCTREVPLAIDEHMGARQGKACMLSVGPGDEKALVADGGCLRILRVFNVFGIHAYSTPAPPRL